MRVVRYFPEESYHHVVRTCHTDQRTKDGSTQRAVIEMARGRLRTRWKLRLQHTLVLPSDELWWPLAVLHATSLVVRVGDTLEA